MKELKIIEQPYNDDILEYNAVSGRYQLTLSYVKSLRDELPYKNDGVARQRIRQTSSTIYMWIIGHGNTVNRSVVSFLLNHTENGRKFLIEVLTSQIEADMEYSINDLGVRPIINAQTGQEGNRDNYKQNLISIDTENVIYNSANYFGFCICVLFPFNWSLFDLARKYEEI